MSSWFSEEKSLYLRQFNHASCNAKVDSLPSIYFQENYETAKIYFCSYHVIPDSVEQYLIILSTSFLRFYSLSLLFPLKLRIFTK